MKSLQFATLAISAGLLFSTTPAFCQAMSEMGSLYSATPRGGPGGLGDAVSGLYNRGAGVPQAPGARAPRLTAEDANQYATQANLSYSNAIKAAKAGKKDVALKEYANAISIRERVWGVGDPAIAELSRKQAEIYKQQGKLSEVENCYRKILASDTRRFGQGAPQLTKTVEILASLCDQQGKNQDALSFYRLLYGLKTKEGGPNRADTKKVRIKLATLMTFTSDFNGAEQLLKEGVATEEALPLHDEAYLGQLYDTYGAVMRATGRPAEAAQMEEKAKAAVNASKQTDGTSAASSQPSAPAGAVQATTDSPDKAQQPKPAATSP